MKHLLNEFVFVLFTTLQVVHLQQLPEFFQVCKLSDEQYDQCLKASVESLRDKLKDGIPSVYIPSLNPLEVPLIQLQHDMYTINITNNRISNLHKFVVKEIHAKHDNATFATTLHAKLHFNEVVYTCDYEVNRSILVITLDTQANSTILFRNVDVDIYLDGEKVAAKEVHYFSLKDLKVDINPHDIVYDAYNLIAGNPTLSRLVLQLVNDNPLEFWSVPKPLFDEIVAQFMRSVFDYVFATWTYDELFPQ